MTTVIELPHVGESVAEGIIGKWLKQVGQRFEKYEPLVEVVTDKVTMEMPAPFSGVLTKVLAKEGDTVPMGAPIAEAEVEGEKKPFGQEEQATKVPESMAPPPSTLASAVSPEEAARRARIGTFTEGNWGGPTGGLPVEEDPDPPAVPPAPPVPSASTLARPAEVVLPTKEARGRFSPVVARLAQEKSVDLNTLRGTGLGGRITKMDVLQYVEERSIGATPSAPAAPVADAGPEEEVVAITPLRRAIAANMVRSHQEIPQAWMAIEVDVTDLVRCRKVVKEEFRVQEGVSLTYLPFIIKVVAEALQEHPDANARWGGDRLIRHTRIHIGIAVGAPEGLVVPVIRNAGNLSIVELAHASHDLIRRAHEGTLRLEDVQGGTFTVNNTGALGTVYSGPLINYPQVAIVTTEAILRRPVVRGDDEIAIRDMMNICLAFDHRALDGLGAGAFLMRIKRGLETLGPDTPIY